MKDSKYFDGYLTWKITTRLYIKPLNNYDTLKIMNSDKLAWSIKHDGLSPLIAL